MGGGGVGGRDAPPPARLARRVIHLCGGGDPFAMLLSFLRAGGPLVSTRAQQGQPQKSPPGRCQRQYRQLPVAPPPGCCHRRRSAASRPASAAVEGVAEGSWRIGTPCAEPLWVGKGRCRRARHWRSQHPAAVGAAVAEAAQRSGMRPRSSRMRQLMRGRAAQLPRDRHARVGPGIQHTDGMLRSYRSGGF